jgi:hypothetical protein
MAADNGLSGVVTVLLAGGANTEAAEEVRREGIAWREIENGPLIPQMSRVKE